MDLLIAMSMENERAILEQLARGEITPELAEDQFSELDHQQPAAHRPVDPAATPSSLPRVRAELSGGGRIEVRGDDTITTPTVEGPASATVTAGDPATVAGNVESEALVRVPAEVDLELIINAADAKLHGIRGQVDATFNVGDVDVDCLLSSGDSRILANCGTLKITFPPGSGVTVTQGCSGDLQLHGDFRRAGRGQWALASGAARLQLNGNLGAIILSGPTAVDDQR